MSMTFTERHGVEVRSSTVASSSLWRVARPRCPGTLPSVVTASAGWEGENTSPKSSLATVTDRASGHRPWAPSRVAALLGPAVRAAVVVSGAFALATATSNTQVQLFAVFGAFSMVVFASFPGSRRRQLRSLTVLVVIGAAFITVGTLCSRYPAAAVASMALVGFGVLFAGILGPQASAGTVAALLAFVLPVAVAGPPGEIPARLAGWLLAGALALPATALLWPRTSGGDLRRRLAGALGALAKLEASHAEGHRDREALVRARSELAALRQQFGSTTFPPTGAGPEESALGKLVGRTEWVGTNAVVPAAQAAVLDLPDVTRVHDAVAGVLTTSAEAVGDPRLVGESPALGRLAGSTARLHSALEHSQDQSLHRLLDGTAEQRANALLDADADTGASAKPGAVTEAEPVPPPTDGTPAPSAGPADRGDDRHDTGRGRLLETLDPTFRARALAFAALMVAEAAAEAARRGRLASAAERRREREMWGSGRTLATAHLSFRSVWFRNSLRGAAALALAVTVVEVTAVEHGFWVILGTLSVLRSNALGTGANVLRAMAGTAVGFVVGSAIMVGLGSHVDLLWAVLPVAVLLSAVAPAAISFAAGQAAFTVVVVVVFNIIEPTGWSVGLTRIEDVALGCSVSLVVCVLFWPRGAAAALGRSLCDAYSAASDYLRAAVERATSVAGDVDTEPARAAGDGPFRRLDDAFRQYVAERGAKPIAPDVATRLVTGAVRIRVFAFSLGTLPRRAVDDVAEPLPSVVTAGEALRQASDHARRWYHSSGEVLAGRATGVPEVHRNRDDLHRLLVEAFRDASSSRRPGDVRAVLRMLWADESLEDELALRRDLHGAVERFRQRRTIWNWF